MQKEQSALSKDLNTAREATFDTVFDSLVLTRKVMVLRLFRSRKKKSLYLLSLNKKMNSGLFQETEKHT